MATSMHGRTASRPRRNRLGTPGTHGTHRRPRCSRTMFRIRLPWDWRVSLYTWTKGIAAGIYLVALLLVAIFGGTRGPTALIAGSPRSAQRRISRHNRADPDWDLEHPERFYLIFTKHHWRSWLVRGAFIIGAYSLVLAGAFSRVTDRQRRRSRVPHSRAYRLPLMTAVYTGYLFAQAKARDLWQNPLLPPHLLVEAILAGRRSRPLPRGSIRRHAGALDPLGRSPRWRTCSSCLRDIHARSRDRARTVRGQIMTRGSYARCSGPRSRWRWPRWRASCRSLRRARRNPARAGRPAHIRARVRASRTIGTSGMRLKRSSAFGNSTRASVPCGMRPRRAAKRFIRERAGIRPRRLSTERTLGRLGRTRIRERGRSAKRIAIARSDDMLQLRVGLRTVGVCRQRDADGPQVRRQSRASGFARTKLREGSGDDQPSQRPRSDLFPLKRAGERGEGKWVHIDWDEALDDIAARIRPAIVEERDNDIMYHVGRPGEDGYTERVMAAWGVDGHNSHTNICSSAAASAMRSGWASTGRAPTMQTPTSSS